MLLQDNSGVFGFAVECQTVRPCQGTWEASSGSMKIRRSSFSIYRHPLLNGSTWWPNSLWWLTRAKCLRNHHWRAHICLPNVTMKKQTPECSYTVSMQHSTDVGHSKIMIRTVDTDVVVLATATIQRLSSNCELWLSFRTGNNLLYLASHDMATQLGPGKARTLPTFHAITGCDPVSNFSGGWKKSDWLTWDVFPELTRALLSLSSGTIVEQMMPAQVM